MFIVILFVKLAGCKHTKKVRKSVEKIGTEWNKMEKIFYLCGT